MMALNAGEIVVRIKLNLLVGLIEHASQEGSLKSLESVHTSNRESGNIHKERSIYKTASVYLVLTYKRRIS